jgi:hypothetical protein
MYVSTAVLRLDPILTLWRGLECSGKVDFLRIIREVKRFINNYIMAHEIHSADKNIDPTLLLLIQAVNLRWNRFYVLLIRSTEEFRGKPCTCNGILLLSSLDVHLIALL